MGNTAGSYLRAFGTLLDEHRKDYRSRFIDNYAKERAKRECIPNQFPFMGPHAPYSGNFNERMDGFKRCVKENSLIEKEKILSEGY